MGFPFSLITSSVMMQVSILSIEGISYIIFSIIFFSACYTPDYKPEDTLILSVDDQIDQQSSHSICDEIIDFSDSGSNTEAPFSIGDIIPDDLLVESDYCFPPDSLGRSFSFFNHPNTVFMIEMSASW